MNVEANSGRSVGSQEKMSERKINKRKYWLIKRRRKTKKIKKIRFWLFCRDENYVNHLLNGRIETSNEPCTR